MNSEADGADGSRAVAQYDANSAEEVASPCTGVCRLHPATGWCEGCFRRIDEIAGWRKLNAAARREILARLPARRQAAAVPSSEDA